MQRRIALLPDIDMEKMAKDSSSLLSSKLPTFFTLDNLHIPHITLAHIHMSDHNLGQVIEILQSIAAEQKSIIVETDGVKTDAHDAKFIGVYFKDNKKIISLRDNVSDAIENIIDDSSTFVRPHITLTRLKHEQDVAEALRLSQNTFQTTSTLSKLAICDIQDHGTVSKVYATYDLG